MRRIILAIAVLTPFAAIAQTSAPAAAPMAAPATAPVTAPAAAPAVPPAGGWQQRFVAKFEAANTTHDGHLTLAQAQAAGMHRIVKNFSAIDTTNQGYVTLQDVQAWYVTHHHPTTAPTQPAAN